MKRLFSFIGLAALAGSMAMAQWSTDRDVATLLIDSQYHLYSNEVCVGVDGTVWFFGDNPASTSMDSIHTTSYNMRLWAFTPEGEPKFGTEGILLSAFPNRSWTVCNYYTCANRDSTITVVVHDCRNSSDNSMSYTAYRLRPDGTHVWDEDGVPVDNAMYASTNCHMSICELDDGSNVFAWEWINSSAAVSLQRITREGESLWDPEQTKLAGAYNEYPFVVDAGNNQFILVWARSSSEYLSAMKYNADGTQVWSKRATIYDGGFGSIPIWTFVDVKPSGDGGVICSWYDARDPSYQFEDVYMAYIKGDGKSGFTNADGGPDVKLSYTEWRHYAPDVYPDGMGTGFLAVYRQTSGGQAYSNIAIQHVNLQGELDWGEEGIDVIPMPTVESTASYCSIRPDYQGHFAVFWQTYHANADIECLMSIRNVSDGQPVNPDAEPIAIVEGGRQRSDLQSFVDTGNSRWYAYWHDGSSTSDDLFYCLQPIAFDGSMPGVAAIEQVRRDELQAGKARYQFSADGRLLVIDPQSGRSYSLSGQLQ